MSDKLVQITRLDGGASADSFPLGGHVYSAPIAADAPSALDGIVSDAGSLFMLKVPAGRSLYVGHKDQVASLSGDNARAVMFPLDAGTWIVTVADAGQATLRLLGDAAFSLRILAAATVDGTA